MGRTMLWSTGYTSCLLEASNLMVSGGHLSWTASTAKDITFSAYLIGKFKGRSGHGWVQALNVVGRVWFFAESLCLFCLFLFCPSDGKMAPPDLIPPLSISPLAALAIS